MSRTRPPDPPTLTPAPAELAAYAHRVRPDIREDDMRGAIQAMQTAGWHWARVQLAVVVALNRGETPHDLRAAVRRTTTRTT